MVLTLRLDDAFVTGATPRPELVLDRRGAILGRSPTVDWSLPDPEKVVSSRHCEIDFRGGGYLLVDTSTNGTLVNDQPLAQPHLLADGDVLTVGRYRILVAIGASQSAASLPPAAAGWGGWDSHAPAASAGVDPAAWDRPTAVAEISGRGALSGQWAAPRIDAPPADPWRSADAGPAAPPPSPGPEAARWGSWSEPVVAAEPASGWSSTPSPPLVPTGEDIWGRIAASNVVDWARGGFGAADPVPVAALPISFVAAPEPSAVTTLPPGPVSALVPGTTSAGGSLDAFAAAAGTSRADLPDDPALAVAAAALLRRLVAGMVVMLEARARAKAQMGAAGTALQFDGNNPLKFARTPEGALKQLLRPPERGFMPAERAVEDAFVDLQAHQIATLKAMQGALRATLDRFSPTAIGGRAERGGLLARILPTARDAALWQAYEREFSGVAQGSDEAFMDVFAREFRRAYDEAANAKG